MLSGNLSVLKKRWEQQQQQQQQPSTSHRPQPQTTPCRPAKLQNHLSQSAGPKPRPASQIDTQPDTLKSTKLSQDEDDEPADPEISEPTFNHLQSAQLRDLTDMEAKPSRDMEGQPRAAEVPDSEKPSVPLNSLKKMFEKGENQADKASVFISVMISSKFVIMSHCTQDIFNISMLSYFADLQLEVRMKHCTFYCIGFT